MEYPFKLKMEKSSENLVSVDEKVTPEEQNASPEGLTDKLVDDLIEDHDRLKAEGKTGEDSIFGETLKTFDNINLDDPNSGKKISEGFGKIAEDVLKLIFPTGSKKGDDQSEGRAEPDGLPDVKDGMDKLMIQLFGEKIAKQVSEKVLVHTFFENTLRETQSLSEAFTRTKEKFSLPDDYEIEIKIKVRFDKGVL